MYLRLTLASSHIELYPRASKEVKKIFVPLSQPPGCGGDEVGYLMCGKLIILIFSPVRAELICGRSSCARLKDVITSQVMTRTRRTYWTSREKLRSATTQRDEEAVWWGTICQHRKKERIRNTMIQKSNICTWVMKKVLLSRTFKRIYWSHTGRNMMINNSICLWECLII